MNNIKEGMSKKEKLHALWDVLGIIKEMAPEQRKNFEEAVGRKFEELGPDHLPINVSCPMAGVGSSVGYTDLERAFSTERPVSICLNCNHYKGLLNGKTGPVVLCGWREIK